MPSPQVNVTLGTAGHIDHGKTALVKCLTGCDTDRLKAEKERGMSIDLGFAPCTIGDAEVGIVDVPGHENFIKTMVAGASGMDAVLLVVAADDGVMPQTREHLDILTILGVQHGMVALTKVDRVDSETLDLVRADTEEYLRGTFLEHAPILPVSSITLEGFDEFYEALFSLLSNVRPKPIDGVFRLPLDRSFTVKGYGTVVSGIPVSGAAHLDDEVELLPHGATGRIRGIEVYGRTSETVQAGQCAAINLRHFDHHSIGRGDTLTTPGYFQPQHWFVAAIRMLPNDKVALKNGANVKLHTGTAEVNAAVYAMQSERLRSGDEQLIQLRAHTPVIAGPGDRFILRTLSPVRTVGGGTIVESVPGRVRRSRPQVVEDLQERATVIGDDRQFVEYCIRKARKMAASESDIAARAKLPASRVEEILTELLEQGRIVALSPRLYVHKQIADRTEERVFAGINEFHQESPESLGMTLDQVREWANIDRQVLDGVLARLKQSGRIVEHKGRLASAEHRATFADEDAAHLDALESLLVERIFNPPNRDEMAQALGADPQTVNRLLKILREHEKTVTLADGLLFHRDAVARAKKIVEDYIQKEGKLESVKFKYLLDTTRKFALPLLDHLDRIGVTRRDGNTRYLKKPTN